MFLQKCNKPMKPNPRFNQTHFFRARPAGTFSLAALCCAVAIAQAQPQFHLPFNEGAGTNITDSVGGLEGPLGIYLDPVVDTAFVSLHDAPSGLTDDHSLRIEGGGYLIADDGTNRALDITNGPITMEAWVYLRTPSPGSTLWEGIARYGGSYKLGLRGRNLAFTLLGKADIFSGRIIPPNQWIHVAAVWNPGVGVTFYTNGVANFVANTQTPARPVFDNYLAVAFEGPSASTTPRGLPGSLDRVRIHHALLSAAQIDNDPAIPKPVYENTLVAYNFDDAGLPAQNAAGTPLPADLAHHFLPGWSSPTWTSDTPTGQPGDFALEFNALTTGITPQSATVLDPSVSIGLNGVNGDYTLEAWMKVPDTFPSSSRRILFQYQGNPGFALSLNSDRTLHTSAFGNIDQVSSATVPNDGAWHHVAVVHQDGVEFRFYVDGVLSDTRAYTLGAGSSTIPRFTIGSGVNGSLPFIGKLDRLRYSNQALDPGQFDFPAAPAVPSLAIHLVDGNVVLTWPAVETEFVLEEADSVTPQDWQVVSHQVVDDRNTAAVPAAGSSKFYRLRK